MSAMRYETGWLGYIRDEILPTWTLKKGAQWFLLKGVNSPSFSGFFSSHRRTEGVGSYIGIINHVFPIDVI